MMSSSSADDTEEQARLYDMLERLQQMASEIPLTLQQRLPSEVLSSLASTLSEAEGQVFQIVRMLTEVQNATEKQLFRKRMELLRKQQDEKRAFDVRHRSSVASETDPDALLALSSKMDAEKEEMARAHEEEIRKFDMNLVLELDQKVTEQQVTLENAGVPGFRVTNNPTEVRVQMHLVDFIRRLTPA